MAKRAVYGEAGTLGRAAGLALAVLAAPSWAQSGSQTQAAPETQDRVIADSLAAMLRAGRSPPSAPTAGVGFLLHALAS